jgi:hypothetical protein
MSKRKRRSDIDALSWLIALSFIAIVAVAVLTLIGQALHFLFVRTWLGYVALFLAACGIYWPAINRRRLQARRRAAERRVVPVEAARSAPERRLLLAREFARLGEEALRLDPLDRTTWPSMVDLKMLRAQTSLLYASATDRSVGFLPETQPGDPLQAAHVAEAIQILDEFVGREQMARTMRELDGEQLRILTRERGRLQTAYDHIVRCIQSN